jgi:YggT family protein
MVSLVLLVDTVLNIFTWIVIVQVVLSWLVQFNVVNARNRVVNTIGEITYRVTEPVLAPIRRFLPSFGNVDWSPLVLILGLWFLRNLMREYLL